MTHSLTPALHAPSARPAGPATPGCLTTTMKPVVKRHQVHSSHIVFSSLVASGRHGSGGVDSLDVELGGVPCTGFRATSSARLRRIDVGAVDQRRTRASADAFKRLFGVSTKSVDVVVPFNLLRRRAHSRLRADQGSLSGSTGLCRALHHPKSLRCSSGRWLREDAVAVLSTPSCSRGRCRSPVGAVPQHRPATDQQSPRRRHDRLLATRPLTLRDVLEDGSPQALYRRTSHETSTSSPRIKGGPWRLMRRRAGSPILGSSSASAPSSRASARVTRRRCSGTAPQ